MVKVVVFELNKRLYSIQVLKVDAAIDTYGKGEQINNIYFKINI